MKRFDMIHLGANVLDNKLDNMDNYELVDAILTAFEDAGMLPPEQPNVFVKCNAMGHGFTRRSYEYKWELNET